uniref:PXA domain-containing protein n=1 Tax=Meloidogyne javanica TaxID=6303 RepID=A0A915M0Y4_MELJA
MDVLLNYNIYVPATVLSSFLILFLWLFEIRYNENLSEDESFTSEIRQLIRHSSAKILTTFMEADVLQIFTDEIIPVIIAHVERVVRILNEFSSERFSSFELQSVSLIELKILEQWPSDSHFATLSQENQLDYLRALSDSLICKFVDDIRIGGCFVDEEHQKMLNREGAIPFSTKWSCHSSRHFLRELLLSTVLIPIIDFCSDPDSLNYFALSFLNQPTFYDSLHSAPKDVGLTENVSNSQSNVYQFLQYNYVIPFYQSENYLGFLCGAPPEFDELIRGIEESNDDEEKFPKVLDSSFSLSQFRKKLFNFIAPSNQVVSTQNSTSSSPFYPSYSTSDLEGFDKDEIIINNMVGGEYDENGGENATIAMSDMGRNLNKWNVNIVGIEQRGGDGIVNPYFVFNIFVERNDLSDDQMLNSQISLTEENVEEEDEFIEKLLQTWNVGHKYLEFYALEDKIKDYYGNSIKNILSLPDRKTTLQLLRIGRNNRTLMESHKIYFERFLQQLVQQPLLKRSDLLYLFLTSEEDSSGFFSPLTEINDSITTSSILSDLNPIKAMRKAAKERGQNLKPFILNLLANVLAPPPTSTNKNFVGNNSSQSTKSSFNLMMKKFVLEEEVNNAEKKSHSEGLKRRQNPFNRNCGSRNSPVNNIMESTDEQIDENIWNNKYSLKSRKIEKILKENLLNVNTATNLVTSLHELVNSWNMPSQCPTPSQISVASSAAALTNLLQLDNNKILQEEIRRKRVNTSASEQERLLRTELLLHRLEKKVEEEVFPFARKFYKCYQGIDGSTTTECVGRVCIRVTHNQSGADKLYCKNFTEPSDPAVGECIKMSEGQMPGQSEYRRNSKKYLNTEKEVVE